MTFHWPQIIYASIYALTLLTYAAKNGQPTNATYNFPVVLVMCGFWTWIMYMGGFFNGTSP